MGSKVEERDIEDGGDAAVCCVRGQFQQGREIWQ